MFRVQQDANVRVQDFVDDVWESLASGPEDVDESLFKERIAKLLALPALDLASSRIMDIRTEVERYFCKAKVFTDLRPAFRRDDNEAPTEMAVVHNFQIGYHDGMGRHQEFYIALDGDDLDKLKRAITQAQKRAQSLANLLDKSNVRLYK